MTPITPESVFAVSGGARGITARCVVELAREFKCNFILLGRTPLEESEPAWAAGGATETELRKQAVAHLEAGGAKPSPQTVRNLGAQILACREIRSTLRKIREAGGRAEYVCADVSNAPQLREGLSRAEEQVGRITGIIHAAGNLADKRIENKTGEDFERVYAAKVTGLQNLLGCVNGNELRRLVLFSSAAGFFGNIGQTDYALANEILNRAAHLFKRIHPGCHVVSFNWGPWDGGMVTPELRRLFKARNVDLIPLETGARLLVDELRSAPAGRVQVVVGGALMHPEGPVEPRLRNIRIRRRLTLEANPFLRDHVIGGRPVLPTVSALSWMAAACEQQSPGFTFFACEDLKVLKGIVFDGAQADEYTVDLEETHKNEGEIHFRVSIGPAGKPVRHYSASIHLRRSLPDPPVYPFQAPDRLPGESHTFYSDGALFHGPFFQGISHVLELGPDKIVLACNLPPVDERAQGQFPVQTLNHFLADVQFQSLVVWAQRHFGAASLPLSCRKGEQYRPIPFGRTFYVTTEIRSSSPTRLVADIFSHNGQGLVYTRTLGAEVTISKQLNPLFASGK